MYSDLPFLLYVPKHDEQLYSTVYNFLYMPKIETMIRLHYTVFLIRAQLDKQRKILNG